MNAIRFPTGPLALAIACALAGPAAHAQTIAGPTAPIREHAMARLEVQGAEAASWTILPAERVDQVEVEGGRQLLFTAPPGTYAVLAAVVVEGRPRLLNATVTFGPDGLPAADPPDPAPPPAPEPTPAPAPPPISEELDRAARAYADSVPAGLREAAALVRSGAIPNVNAVVDAVAARREAARVRFGQALDAATSGTYDRSGRISDPARYSDALERAAAALGGQP